MTESLIACRPVYWEQLPPPMNTYQPTEISPGSIVDRCRKCDIALYVGPLQQQAEGIRICFGCAAEIVRAVGVENVDPHILNPFS